MTVVPSAFLVPLAPGASSSTSALALRVPTLVPLAAASWISVGVASLYAGTAAPPLHQAFDPDTLNVLTLSGSATALQPITPTATVGLAFDQAQPASSSFDPNTPTPAGT